MEEFYKSAFLRHQSIISCCEAVEHTLAITLKSVNDYSPYARLLLIEGGILRNQGISDI
jgi:hypothetical protein